MILESVVRKENIFKMTIRECCNVVCKTMKGLGGKAISAIADASIGSLVKIGVLIGTAVVSVYLATKKMRDMMKTVKHVKNGTRHPDDRPAAADVGSSVDYDSVRARMRKKTKGTYDQRVVRDRSKYWQGLDREEREELEELEKQIAESILGDLYDESIKYTDPHMVKYAHGLKDLAKKKKAEVDFLNETKLSDDVCIWKFWHGPRMA